MVSKQVIYFNSLGRQDSNLGMPAPKAGVLPLDDAPNLSEFTQT